MNIPVEVQEIIMSFGDFAPGVPADDATCNHFIEVLQSLHERSIDGKDSQYDYVQDTPNPWRMWRIGKLCSARGNQ